MTLREAKRGSAGVPVAMCEAAEQHRELNEWSYDAKVSILSAQILPRPSQILSKPSPNPSKIHPKSIQTVSWSLYGTNALQKWGFERPQNSPKSPKSTQKRAQSAPNPSQMQPKTLPDPVLNRFFGMYFPNPNLH